MDQWFGDLAKWVRRYLTFAKTVEDFLVSMNRFANSCWRPHESIGLAFKLDKIRGWKLYFAHLGKKLVGIGGPSAPHHFEFVRREGAISSLCSS